MISIRKPVPGALRAGVCDAFEGSDGSGGVSKFFGSSGSFGLSLAASSACGEVLFRKSASGVLGPQEQLLMISRTP